MDIIAYQEKLGIGFNDQDKWGLLINQVFNTLHSVSSNPMYCGIDYDEYFDFCNATGVAININLNFDYHSRDRFRTCLDILNKWSENEKEFLYAYMALFHAINPQKNHGFTRIMCKKILLNALKDNHIPYQIIGEENDIWIFPKGAEELDQALVSEPLDWLDRYPQARGTYVIALKQYVDGIYIRDVADNLRKTLEAFLQEFLGNTKNLETNKNEICQYLGSQGVDPGIAGLFQPLITAYKNINDRIAKHNDKVDKRLLEFLLYQTGVLIRMVISVKMSEAGGELDAD